MNDNSRPVQSANFRMVSAKGGLTSKKSDPVITPQPQQPNLNNQMMVRIEETQIPVVSIQYEEIVAGFLKNERFTRMLTNILSQNERFRGPPGIGLPGEKGNKQELVFNTRSVLENEQIFDDDQLLLINSRDGPITIDLTSVEEFPENKLLIFKKIDPTNNVITIQCEKSDDIDGQKTMRILNRFESIMLQSDGVSSWNVLSHYKPTNE